MSQKTFLVRVARDDRERLAEVRRALKDAKVKPTEQPDGPDVRFLVPALQLARAQAVLQGRGG